MKFFSTMLMTMTLIASVSGCVSSGRDFPSDDSWIKDHQTKQDDVKLILGEPVAVGRSSNQPTWTYQYFRWELFAGSWNKELKIYWTPEKTVASHTFTSSFPEDKQRALGNAPAKTPAPPKK